MTKARDLAAILSAGSVLADGAVSLGEVTGGTNNGVVYVDGSGTTTNGSGLVFDGTNLGLGVTPSAWASYKVIDLATNGLSVAGSSEAGDITVNAYWDFGWKYKGTGTYKVTRYNQFDGSHAWFTAPSGTAGNAISFTQAMTLNASGNLGIGTSDPQSLLHVSAGSAGSVYTALTLQNTDNSSSGQGTQIVFKNSSYSGVEAAKYGYIRYFAHSNYGENGAFYIGTNNGYGVSPVNRVKIDYNGDFYPNVNGGSVYARAGGSYSAVTDLGWTAPIQLEEAYTGTTAYRYIPMISQTSVSSSGYRQHTVLGSARAGVWGDFFIAVGGNDAYPTTAFTFSYQGVFTAPSTKNFVIPHPLPELKETTELVHAAIEAPSADLIYRGVAQLVGGQAIVNVDAVSRMTEGTFELLCRNVQCFTTNESDWTPVRGTVSGNILTIQAQDSASQAQVSWMVIGERKDENVMRSYDEQGNFIVERPAKQTETT